MSEVKERYMNTRVYYGEYTLRHWLNLMLTRNIDLPEYQRSFVWNEDDVKRGTGGRVPVSRIKGVSNNQ
jgi:hypothetical protein